MTSPKTPSKNQAEIADARDAIAHAERHRRIWRRIRLGMMVVLSIFLTVLLVYTGLAIGSGAGVWQWGFMLVGDAFLAFLLVMVARHRGIEGMLDAEVAEATRRLTAAGVKVDGA